MKNFRTNQALVGKWRTLGDGVEGSKEVGAFGGRVKDFRVVGGFYALDFHAVHSDVQSAVAMGTSVEAATWDGTAVSKDCWFFEGFAAAFVGAFQVFFVVASVENWHGPIRPPLFDMNRAYYDLINLSVYTHNKNTHHQSKKSGASSGP